MIRHNVENLPHAVLMQRCAHPPMAFDAAQFDVDAPRVHDIVTVLAAWDRLQIRRAVEMADPEFRKVARQVGRIIEAELRMELNTICCAGMNHALSWMRPNCLRLRKGHQIWHQLRLPRTKSRLSSRRSYDLLDTVHRY